MYFQIIISFIVLIISSTHGLVAQQINFDKYKGITTDKNSVRIASISVIPDKWKKETNWIRIESMVREAVVMGGAQFIVTPEGALEGYVINEVNSSMKSGNDNATLKRFFKIGEPLNGAYIKKASSLANELNIYFILGFLEREHDSLFNTALLFDPDGWIIGRYRKTHFAQGYIDNPEFYKAGDDFPVFQTSFGKVGILICYDRQLPEPARILKLNGAELLVIPSYGGYSDEDGWNTILLRARARENSIPLVFCHPFQSLHIRSDGEISEIGTSGTISYSEFKISNDTNNILRNRRPEIYDMLNKTITK